VWTAIRTGLLPDEQLQVTAGALRSDWLLAAGCLLSLLGCVVVGVVVGRDARWRRRLDAQADAATLDRRLLLSRLDHELKNPLTAMRAALANVSAAGAGADQVAGIASIETQVARLSRLTAELRKIADVESTGVDNRPVDVAALLEEAMEIAREQPAAASRSLQLDLPRAPWPLPAVRGDWELLSLVLLNLVDNAVKYTAPGDRIEVRARETDGAVVVEVADTGPGIPADDLPHIWEELYRSPRARTVAGSGLGLALVRAVVEAHGGSVAAESRLGRGTLIRVQLPCGAPEA
jgi:two-component system OmpR family sensor kinase